MLELRRTWHTGRQSGPDPVSHDMDEPQSFVTVEPLPIDCLQRLSSEALPELV